MWIHQTNVKFYGSVQTTFKQNILQNYNCNLAQQCFCLHNAPPACKNRKLASLQCQWRSFISLCFRRLNIKYLDLTSHCVLSTSQQQRQNETSQLISFGLILFMTSDELSSDTSTPVARRQPHHAANIAYTPQSGRWLL